MIGVEVDDMQSLGRGQEVINSGEGVVDAVIDADASIGHPH